MRHARFERLASALACSLATLTASSRAIADPTPITQPPPPPPVVVVTPPPPEPAPPPPPPPPPSDDEPDLDKHGGAEVSLGAITFAQAGLDKASFSFDGAEGTVQATGRQLGIVTPRFYGAALEVAYLRRHLAVGGIVTFAWAAQDGKPETNVGNFRAMAAAVDIAAILPLGDVAVRLAPIVGVRGYFVELPGVEGSSCGYSRDDLCEAATKVQPYFEPRLRIDWTPRTSNFFVGAFASLNAFDTPTVGAGLLLGTHTPRIDELAP